MNMEAIQWEPIPDTANDDVSADLATYKNLLESTLVIPWRVDWASQKYTYIGPQIEALLGWKRESWDTVECWASRIHPNERNRTVQQCITQSLAGLDHEADFRVLAADGSYTWIREIVHVVRNDLGEVDSLIGFMIDISRQKKAEQEMLDLKAKLEKLSYQDGLTGVANRRLYNEKLTAVWNASIKRGNSLAIILLDIDYFKQFNDFYGHLAGDECLMRVANELTKVGVTEQDVVARYGGEEFVVLLTDTNPEQALEIAEACRRNVEALHIPHEASICSSVVTVSVGVQSIVPEPSSVLRDFCFEVDSLLYRAKAGGRNRVVGELVQP